MNGRKSMEISMLLKTYGLGCSPDTKQVLVLERQRSKLAAFASFDFLTLEREHEKGHEEADFSMQITPASKRKKLKK
jgi:hypothetical protein